MNKCEFKDIKEAIQYQFKEDLETLKELYDPQNCFFVDVEKIEKSLKNCFEFLIKEINSSYDLLNYFVMDNNEKINKKGGIFGFSIKPYVLCDNMLNGGCKISKWCYASKNELAFREDKNNNIRFYSLEKTLKNYIWYHYILFSNDELKGYPFLRETLKHHKNELNKFEVIRFNIKGDFINQRHLNFCNDLFTILKSDFGIKRAYGYTKTQNLNFEALNKDFIINQSLIIENKEDLEKINPQNFQFVTLLNEDLEKHLSKVFNLKRCKNQTQNLKCFQCKQCLEIKAKYNIKH